MTDSVLKRLTANEQDNNSYGVFDEETNIYEESSAKKRVDKWFEEILEIGF